MWFMGDIVGDGKNSTEIDAKKVKWGIEAYHFLLSKKYLARIFSAQWREDMRKTPNVIFEYFRGLGKK